MNLIKYRAQKNKNVIYRPCSVRIGRYLPSVMKMALGLRPRAIFMTSGKYLPIRTSRPVNNIYVFVKQKFSRSDRGFRRRHQRLSTTNSKGVHQGLEHRFRRRWSSFKRRSSRFFTTCLITATSTSKLYSYDIASLDLFYYFVPRLYSADI